MHSEYYNIKHIPLNVFYDKSILRSGHKLPSEKRNIDIIHGITFGQFLTHIQNNDASNIKSWLIQHEKKFTSYLKRKQYAVKENERKKYCTNLNYILDFVVQSIDKLNDIQYASLKHQFQTKSRDILKIYTRLDCIRNYDNFDDKHLYIKKIMYDLYEDILYMIWAEQIIGYEKCSKMIGRIKDRRNILTAIHRASSDKSIFDFDEECTLPNIDKMLQDLKCTKTPKAPPTVTVTEQQTFTALPGSGGDLSETRRSEDVEDPIDVENPESVDTFPEDLTISLPVNDDPPKLDTTYAAASLAGVSLFGTILYKVKYYRINEILCTSFIFYVI
ncbi:hypothetical protein PVIIG_06006 [Plasmodium vivax India VII]|uniref:Pv-fam-c protein n=1 Tax=Plasmodium vivax India VII TaxID=1077284 RepID=A0A0J9SHC8_PLAVI|nr:hypothetical protein PVIIG_06006 [Plasmodium vivax India VII]